MGVLGHRHALATVPYERVPLPIVQEAGWALRMIWMGAENLIPTTVQTLNCPVNGTLLKSLPYPGHPFYYISLLSAFIK
jgi:hypothetical protein